MATVEPIRDKYLIKDICNYLKKNNERNYILFLVGIHTGLRISDILMIKIRDIKDKSYIDILEQKTNKKTRVFINNELKKEIKKYTKDKDPDEYLIKSRVGYNKPIDRSTAYKILRDIGDKFNIKNIGCHTLRKTWAYSYYKETKDLAIIQDILNHSDLSITKRYLGLNMDTREQAYKRLRFLD